MSLKCKSEDAKYNFNKVILRIHNVSFPMLLLFFLTRCLMHSPRQTDKKEDGLDIGLGTSELFLQEAGFLNPYFKCEVLVVF